MPATEDIRHVSDTALMAAACRAMETVRPDGLIRDPFAERLAGERGMAIVRALSRGEMLCFGIGIRSRFLDELVVDTVRSRGIATVLCLGAGLDARPWRLDLPAGLRWIEVDFPAMLDYKREIMAAEAPKCNVERMPADLADPAARREIFARVGPAPALMITEGLLMYLPGRVVEALASEARRDSGIRYWLTDITSAAFANRVNMGADPSIQNVRAPDHLNGAQIVDVLKRKGWSSLRWRNYTSDAWDAAKDRIVSMMAARTSAENMGPIPPDDPTGVHLFGEERPALRSMLARAGDSVLVIVDIQERLAAAMEPEARERVMRNSRILLEAARRLCIPVLVTEQYPRGLGSTAAEVLEMLPEGLQRVEKTCFSSCGAEPFAAALEATGRKQVIVAGMEAHVCVLQTALELRAGREEVFAVEDACCSRNPENHANAMHRMRAAGVVVANTESVVFEWLRDARHEHFKPISALVR